MRKQFKNKEMKDPFIACCLQRLSVEVRSLTYNNSLQMYYYNV